MKLFLENLKPELELAEKYNSYIAIESQRQFIAQLPRFDQGFRRSEPPPASGHCLGPVSHPGQQESVEEAIRTCGNQLFFFMPGKMRPATGQLRGLDRPIALRGWPPWPKSTSATRSIPSCITNRPDAMAEAMARSAKYLKSCYEKAVATR